MKVTLVGVTAAPGSWLLGAVDGRAVLGNHDGIRTSDGTAITGGKGHFVTDGTRLAFVGEKQLTVVADRTFAVALPRKNGKEVSLLSVAMAPGENAIWAVFSDTFAIAQGRFIARLTWTGKKAVWGPLKSPFAWSPYSHGGMFLESIGAATLETAFVSAFSEVTAVLAQVGKHANKGVPIARGVVSFGVASLLVFANRKFAFLDAEGKETATFGFSGAIKAAIGKPSNLAHTVVQGRDLWMFTHTEELVHVQLDVEPAALITSRSKRAATPTLVKTTGLYGALDPSRSRAQVIAIERVQAWDLNETPAFGKPATFQALNLQKGVLSFCREREGRLRKSFDFMTSAVVVTTSEPPKAARAPKGVVLASLRTPSGLTQVLCRAEFAAILMANTKRRIS